MPTRDAVIGTVAALCLFLAGCDKHSSSNSPPAGTVNSDAATQASEQDSRKKLPLISVPLVMSLPQSWKMDPPNNPAYLVGPAPDGKVWVSLSMLDSQTDSARRLYIAAAIDEGNKHPRRIQIRQSTTDSGMQVLERVTYAHRPATVPDQSASTTQPSEPLSWSIIVFVPYEQKFIPCSFDLLKLTQQQYTDDQSFIESIVDTAEPGDLNAFK